MLFAITTKTYKHDINPSNSPPLPGYGRVGFWVLHLLPVQHTTSHPTTFHFWSSLTDGSTSCLLIWKERKIKNYSLRQYTTFQQLWSGLFQSLHKHGQARGGSRIFQEGKGAGWYFGAAESMGHVPKILQIESRLTRNSSNAAKQKLKWGTCPKSLSLFLL